MGFRPSLILAGITTIPYDPRRHSSHHRRRPEHPRCLSQSLLIVALLSSVVPGRFDLALLTLKPLRRSSCSRSAWQRALLVRCFALKHTSNPSPLSTTRYHHLGTLSTHNSLLCSCLALFSTHASSSTTHHHRPVHHHYLTGASPSLAYPRRLRSFLDDGSSTTANQ